MTTHAVLVPEIRIDSVRRLVDDGTHNGFTDLCHFNGHIYLSFRSSPTGHGVWNDSSVVIMRSKDGKDWQRVFTYNVPGRDIRDPHCLVFQGKLFVYSSSWLVHNPALKEGEHDVADHLGYVIWTEDGHSWHGPQAIEASRGHYIWRAATDGKKAHLGARGGKPIGSHRHEWEELMLESDDGLTFRKPGWVYQIGEASETAFLFEDDGTMVAVSRCLGSGKICRGKPPNGPWTWTPLNRYIGGPMLSKWGKHYLVGGRKRLAPKVHVLSLGWLVDDQLIDVVDLPSGGDTAYSGFVPLSETRGLLSYYSSHAGSGTIDAPAHIYLAEISLVQP